MITRASVLTDPSRRADYDITKDSVSFNKTIFAKTRSFFKTEQITFQQAADARLAQYTYSQKNNPKYSMSPLGDQFSAGESAAYLFLMGDIEKLTAPRKFVEYLFGRLHSSIVRHGMCADERNRERKTADGDRVEETCASVYGGGFELWNQSYLQRDEGA